MFEIRLAPWVGPTMNRFGKPCTWMPCRLRMPSAQSSESVTPSRPTVVEAGAPRELGADLEARGVDQAVELVVLVADPHAGLVDPLDTLAVGVDEVGARVVERLEVLVVEARPLAELAVPGLERLGGGRVVDDLRRRGRGSRSSSRRRCRGTPARTPPGVNSGFSDSRTACRGCAGRCRSSRPSRGPRRRTRRSAACVKFIEPLAAASRVRASRTTSGSVGWLLRTSIDDGVRWNTNSSPHAAGEVRDALHRRGAGADDADPLVGELRPSARRPGRRRCSRSPSGWCGSCGPRTSRCRGCRAASAGAAARCPSPRTWPASRRRGWCG